MSARRELLYWLILSPEEQRSAIVRMSAEGMTDYLIANATGLSVEFVRQIIGAARECASKR